MQELRGRQCLERTFGLRIARRDQELETECLQVNCDDVGDEGTR